jgi:hypothetical protein
MQFQQTPPRRHYAILPFTAWIALTLAAPQAYAASPPESAPEPAPIEPVDWRDHDASEHLNPALGDPPTDVPEPAPEVEPAPEPVQPTPLAEPTPEPPAPVIAAHPAPMIDHPQQHRLGGVGVAGVATLVGGVATIGGGLLLMSMPNFQYDVDPRKVGAVILGVGGAATALGIVATIIDVKLLEPRRVRVFADLSTTQAGLSIAGNF